MSVILGIGGARRNAATALSCNGRLVASCEQERLVRTRGIGILPGTLPCEAVESVLRIAGRTQEEVTTYAAAEQAVILPSRLPGVHIDHHLGHAATAYLSSPFNAAVVFVCDHHSPAEVSVWRGQGPSLVPVDWPWQGHGFARVYSRVTAALGFASEGDEHKMEGLARVNGAPGADRARALISDAGHRLEVDDRLEDRLREWIAEDSQRDQLAARAAVASSLQNHLGELLLKCLREVRDEVGATHLCLGGGLFYNTYFNTRVAQSALFEQTFVPINPGNAGLAAGAALAVARANGATSGPELVSPFLGPEYAAEEIKGVLDNCKLVYDFARDGALIETTVRALTRGQLVGWFHDRMEWGPRALGNRSILADPRAPYVLDNLNVFLKRRERYRSYGVVVCEEDLGRYFEGPPASPFMEYEYHAKDPEIFRHLMPWGTCPIRVQTVGEVPGPLRRLLKAFGSATGVPVLVNTSFNGFHEPIVCSPRDAVRVFYGTGLDMLTIGNFIVQKWNFILHK